MYIFDKLKEINKTSLREPVITVEIFAYSGYSLDGIPFNKYYKSIGFYNENDFEEFKKQNNL